MGLQGLFGSKSIEKILLFLLVNEKTYATQLHRLLGSPLTPIQKALEKLEKEGILTSEFQGKTRLFTFNRQYPLLNELEILLKKAYSLLGPREKGQYYFIRQSQKKHNQLLLFELWQKMKKVKKVAFQFRSQNNRGGYGFANVKVAYNQDAMIVFEEKGTWKGDGDLEFSFKNVFRWTLNRIDGMLTLEHLRFGEKNPVFLFHLVPKGEAYLESLHPHLCGEDTYFGQILLSPESIELIWRILGPKKNEEIKYNYC